ncbi:phosphatase PAP2 family protein [Solilutibacter tolerans]|uniref:undecaprenyl-diphosphate phosphatase n=1 Tax=Solilutibacter tolerans TaxID=1604334 RepID=A0A1N6VBX5_9GAMM|nr:phosphatase PAP2 family protein [Lysobacter tolerans]SIQ75354.1 undecaprenyl-diphosphatase [Lysobacter tolerans]
MATHALPETAQRRTTPASPRSRGRLVRREGRWCRHANALGRLSGCRAYFATISRLGDGMFWYGLMGAMVLLDGMQGLRASAHLATVGAASLLLYKGLKRWTRRPRPFAADRHIRAWVAPLDEFSFPSGHTLHAVAFTIVALAYYPMLAWLLIPFTASVALSRVVLGLHYPSDVLAATGIGSVLAIGSMWLFPMASVLG